MWDIRKAVQALNTNDGLIFHSETCFYFCCVFLQLFVRCIVVTTCPPLMLNVRVGEKNVWRKNERKHTLSELDFALWQKSVVRFELWRILKTISMYLAKISWFESGSKDSVRDGMSKSAQKKLEVRLDMTFSHIIPVAFGFWAFRGSLPFKSTAG